jgi:AraC family transcriptional regulator
LNLEGTSLLRDESGTLTLKQGSLAFYHSGRPALAATRAAGERHRFLTVEYSDAFLSRQFREQAADLQPLVRGVMEKKELSSSVVVLPPGALELSQWIASLRHPPVFAPAQRVWFASKAVELGALFFFQPGGPELFCTRAKRHGHERVEKAQAILRSRYEEPPSLDELSREVGCSQFYLSRLFSQKAGMTIQQYVRQVRLERAAELLRNGKCNVTEAALAVGYNSLSHFSSAFHERYGCCPGLYPLQTRAQRNDEF